MKQQSLFGFVKKMDREEIEKKKIELNQETTILTKKSVNLIRKRSKCHLLDGMNYNPENCIIKNENKILNPSSSNIPNIPLNKSCSLTSTPNKKLKLENKENIEINKSELFNGSFEINESFFDESFDDIKSSNALKSFYRVKVVNVDLINDYKEIMACIDYDEVVICIQLKGNWIDTDVIPNDICHIINPIFIAQKWQITDTQGLIVVNPDSLLSGTTIVGSLFCKRKTILQTYFSDIAGKTNKAMLLGTFIHNIFQECVVKGFVNLDIIKAVAAKLLLNKQCLLQFYEADLLESEIMKEMDIYFPHILKWVNKNISRNIKVASSGFKRVLDIEENVWSGKYGMKGKVDVTLQENDKCILPLELKTGKTSFSNDHIGQVILYTLMLSEKRDQDVDKGLLLYVKDGQERIIESKPASVTGLVKMRNELCKHLLHFLNTDIQDTNSLPEVIDSDRMCSKCEYLSLCTLFSRLSAKEFTNNHAMNNLIKENTKHLSDQDFQFFVRWIELILMEYFSIHRGEEVIRNIVNNKSINCIRNATFDSSMRDGTGFLLSFTFPHDNNNTFTEGDPIIVSTNDGSKLAITIGFVSGSVGIGRISITSDKLLPCSKSTIYRMDPYHSLRIPLLNLSLMANLMNSSENSKQLRNLIVKGDPPVFESSLSSDMIEKIKPILKKSNKDQRKAILMALLAQNYTLIKGYPGSGKTSCIVSMIRVFSMTGAKVLVSSYTHSAVVNILKKLDQKETSFVYLNGSRRACPELMPRTLDSLMESNKVQNSSDVHKLLEGISVFGVTCLSVHHSSLSKIKFDLVIIDEAGQITLPISLMLLSKLKTENSRFVMVGDPHQLPPLVTNSHARTDGLDKSLLAVLSDFNPPRVTAELTIQYRMNSEILRLCNEITYDNCITCTNDSVANATVPHLSDNKQKREDMTPWMNRCLSGDIGDSVIFLNHVSTRAEQAYTNESECTVIVRIIEEMVRVWVLPTSIGVISPYNTQVDLMRRLCPHSNEEINNKYLPDNVMYCLDVRLCVWRERERDGDRE